jgi:hypothetical protein
MRIAQAFSETVVATFGAEKLDRALHYVAATPARETPKEIPNLKIRVPPRTAAQRCRDRSPRWRPVHSVIRKAAFACRHQRVR